jgi:hypothetical protein
VETAKRCYMENFRGIRNEQKDPGCCAVM